MTFQQLASVDLNALNKTQLKAYTKLAREEWGNPIDLRSANIHDLIEYLQMYLRFKAESDNSISCTESEAIALQDAVVTKVEPIRTLSDFEGIEPEVMAVTDWFTATPISCDVCSYQICELPNYNIFIQMQLSDFRATYPRLFVKLVDFRAQAIAKTPTFLQGQQRGLINVANFQMREIHLDSPVMRRSSEFYEQIPTALVHHDSQHGEHSERYKLLEATVSEAKAELSKLGKLLPTSPTASDYAKARCEVETYLTAYLQHGSKAIANLDLSAVEQFQLSQLYWKGQGFVRLNENWEYLVARGDDYNALVEPVIKSLLLGGESVAHVTKNSYGVLCLNSSRVMFIDIDTDFTAEDIATSAMPWGRVQVEESEILANIHDVAKDTGLIFEIYRTANGFRLIEMSRTWDANSYESQALLERLGSDRLYQKLCLAQGCYRARLQPKPWRSGDTVCIHAGTASEASDLSAFKLSPPLHEEALFIKAVHDRYCCTGDDLA